MLFFAFLFLIFLFSKENEKEVGELGGCGGEEELGENGGGETVIRIYCMKNLIFNKNIFIQVKKRNILARLNFQKEEITGR